MYGFVLPALSEELLVQVLSVYLIAGIKTSHTILAHMFSVVKSICRCLPIDFFDRMCYNIGWGRKICSISKGHITQNKFLN